MTPRALALLASAAASLQAAPAAHRPEPALDVTPLHAMRRGLVGLRDKLAAELASVHGVELPEPQPLAEIDGHFRDLTRRLLQMDDTLSRSLGDTEDPAYKAAAVQLRNLAAQATHVLGRVDGTQPVHALEEAKNQLARLQQHLHALPRPRAALAAPRAAPHSLVEKAVTAQGAHALDRFDEHDAALDSMDDLSAAIKRQVDGLRSSLASDTRRQASSVQAALESGGALAPAPEDAAPEAPAPRVTEIGLGAGFAATPEFADLPSLSTLDSQFRGSA